ncbi:MAG: RNA polymerase sigma factor SigJ [Acidimicrobiales bacterium]
MSAAGTPEHLALFEEERPRLLGLAYRLLGSLGDAEDVLQEAWIRWSRSDLDVVERPAAWLTTTVSRLGLDRLRARRRDRMEYVGPWLPEPIVAPITATGASPSADPADAAELADSLTTAFLVMLEQLSPEERLVVLLADVFAEPFPAVADLLGRSPDATRQLAVRARRKLAAASAASDPTDDEGPARIRTARPPASEQLAVAAAFVDAVVRGDLDAAKSMLHPDTVLTSDGGPHRHAARRPVRGPDRVARFLINIARRVPPSMTIEPVWVNGAPGLVHSLGGHPYMVSILEVRDGLVHRQYSVLNPDKLAAIGRQIELT